MRPVTRLQLKHFALAVGFVAVVTVLWQAAPVLSEWVAADSVLIGGLVGMLIASVGSAYHAGRRDAA